MHRAVLLLALLALPLATPVVEAQSPRVWTVFTTVSATVQGNYATVHVIEDIANHGRDPEFPFQVRIPDDALITGLTIERDGQTYVAQIAPRETARQQYEATKEAQQTGGLVEKDRHSSLYSYLINVAETTSVRATLTYERYLSADRGVYNLSLEAPVSSFGKDQGARFLVDVTDPAGIDAAWGVPAADTLAVAQGKALRYEVGPRTSDAPTLFTASYTPSAIPDGGALRTMTLNGTGYFMHVFRAGPDAARMPIDMALVLDVSGSMSGQKLQQMKDAAGQLVRGLRGDDRLALVVFSSEASPAWTGLRAMTTANRAEAAREVDALLAGGGTNLESALKASFGSYHDISSASGRLPEVVLLTDGQATEGNTDRAALRALARDANSAGADVFAIAFGSDADWSFIHGIAEDGHGIALRVPEGAGAEVDLRRFLSLLATPTLKDVSLSFHGNDTCAPPADCRDVSGVHVLAPYAPVLFSGSELLVVGTYDISMGMPDVVVHAEAADGARSYVAKPVAGEVPFLPRLVAYQQVRDLETRADADGATPAIASALRELGMTWGFVTDETSLVLSLDPRTPQPASGTTMGSEASADSSAYALSYDRSGVADPTGAAPAHSIAMGNGGNVPVASTPATPSSGSASGSPTPSAKVPAPAAALALVAVASLALVLRRR